MICPIERPELVAKLDSRTTVIVTNEGVFYIGVKVCSHTGDLGKILEYAKTVIDKFHMTEAK